jgi:hypothetical protein
MAQDRSEGIPLSGDSEGETTRSEGSIGAVGGSSRRIVVAVPGPIVFDGTGHPKVVVGGDQPRLFVGDLAAGDIRTTEGRPLELAAVRHQPQKITGDREATDVDQDEGAQLSARPFHEAPLVLLISYVLTAIAQCQNLGKKYPKFVMDVKSFVFNLLRA